ncbi:hypothetical protein M885DRAFT_617202 [Pelagophyceae sp. CCMP2097]|nr:hypothetical protein M885DRAFT_617202 [Pelagophyceae sp. CCMP2097]
MGALARRLRRAFGHGGDVALAAKKAAFEAALRATEKLGAGLAEHLILLRRYFVAGERLAKLEAEACGGARKDDRKSIGVEEPVEEPPALAAATASAAERWADANAVVRRSAAAVVVEHALQPLRAFHAAAGARVAAALDAHARAWADGGDAATVAAARAAAAAALDESVAEHGKLVDRVSVVLAAVHAELFAHVARGLDGAAEGLPPAARRSVEAQMAASIKAGGPVAPRAKRTAARKVFDVVTGQKRFGEHDRHDRAERERRRQIEIFRNQLANAEESAAARAGEAPHTPAPPAAPPPPGLLAAQRAPPPRPSDDADAGPRKSMRLFATTVAPPRPDGPQAFVEAIYNCSPDKADELCFSQGHKMAVVDDETGGCPAGWLLCQMPYTGISGYVPENYVRRL